MISPTTEQPLQTVNNSLDCSPLDSSLLPLAIFLAEDRINYNEALKDLVGEPSPESFQKALDLMKLCAAEDYHRSARDILQTAVSAGHRIYGDPLLSSLPAIADKILERTYKIGAWTINDSIRDLLQNWPSVAEEFPNTRDAVIERYGQPLNMGAGEMVNRLRSNPISDVIEEAKANVHGVVKDLLDQRAYGWLVDFLAQSNEYGIMSPELYNQVAHDLDQDLRSNGSLICRWYLYKVMEEREKHTSSLGEAQLPMRQSE